MPPSAARPVRSCIRTLLLPRRELVGQVIEQAWHDEEEHLSAFEQAQTGKFWRAWRSDGLTPLLKLTQLQHDAGRRPLPCLAQVEVALPMGFSQPFRQRNPSTLRVRARDSAELRWDGPGADPMVRMKDAPFTKKERARRRLRWVHCCPKDGAKPLA